MSPAALMLAAWAVEALFGWPQCLYRLIRHPVVWLGTGISWLERAFNHPSWPHPARYVAGALSSLFVIFVATALAFAISRALPDTPPGRAVEALLASSLIASRSLYTHVAAVARPLSAHDIAGARTAVSQIVGRDPAQLDEAGVARAALESLAENASDGVTAPLFWGALFGLPGLAAYKAVNTLDSMIGHRNTRYAAFGGFAARLDDVANLVPARLTGLAFAAVSGGASSLRTMLNDARRHRSPNAGWPEAAMAGALGVRLSGPRRYGDRTSDEPWLNPAAPDPSPQAVKRGLSLYVRAMVLLAAMLACAALARSLA